MRVVGIGSVFTCTEIADTNISGIVGVGMTARSNQPISGIISAGKGTIREHIAVKIIAYGVAIERDQTVVGVILEAAVGGRGYVTCCIVVEGLGRYHRVIAELLDSSRSDSAEIIISITHFGRICKYLFFDNSRQVVISVFKACNYRAGCRSFNGRSHSLLVVVDGGCYTSVGLGNAYYTVVCIVGISRDTVCPVGYAYKIVVCVIRIGYGSIIRVNNLREITNRIILIANDFSVCVSVARYTVESIVGSCDRAVAVVYGQYVAVCVVSVAYSAFGGSIARDSAHGVIEDLTNLTACVGDLLANVQLVVLVRLCTARNGGLGCEPAHIVVGVIGSTAERSCKACYIAEKIICCGTCVVCSVADGCVLTA